MIRPTDSELVAAAIEAAKRAYSPYSGCRVGAALLCSDGTVFTGSNIENASFGATVCAERTALFSAVHNGKREFSSIAISGEREGKFSSFYPCGICLQTLCEFCPPDMRVLVVKSPTEWQTLTLSELLPKSFSLEDK